MVEKGGGEGVKGGGEGVERKRKEERGREGRKKKGEEGGKGRREL